MKAVIMQIQSEETIILNKEGNYIKIETLPHYKVGCEIEYTPAFSVRNFMQYVSVAAILLLVIGIGGFIHIYLSPYSYIDMEINPGIEITTNRFDYIIKLHPLNGDGAELLTKQRLLHKPLKDGISLLLDQLENENYLSGEEERALVFSIAANNQNKINYFENQIGEIVHHRLYNDNGVEVYVVHSSLQSHEQAREYNLSSGKLLLIEKLQKTNNALSIDDLKDVSIRDVIRIARQKQANENNAADSNLENLTRELPVRQILLRERRNNEGEKGDNLMEEEAARQRQEPEANATGEQIRNAGQRILSERARLSPAHSSDQNTRRANLSNAPAADEKINRRQMVQEYVNSSNSSRTSQQGAQEENGGENPPAQRETLLEKAREAERRRSIAAEADESKENQDREQAHSENDIGRSVTPAENRRRTEASIKQRGEESLQQ